MIASINIKEKVYFSQLCLFFLVGDLFFIGLHYANRGMFDLWKWRWSLSHNGGYAEIFQYGKFALLLACFAFLVCKHKVNQFLSWFILFLYLLVDDYTGIRETVGIAIAKRLDFPLPYDLNMIEIGELIVSLVVAGILFPFVFLSYGQGSETFRKVSRGIIFWIFVLVFFGVGVDILHSMFSGQWASEFYFGLIEDGGEMVAVSFLAAYVFKEKHVFFKSN